MPTVFVSYCHEDSKWFDPTRSCHLIPWLEKVLRPDKVELWYDRSDRAGLKPGDRFEAEILDVIDRADLALLLVSEAFLSSDFISKVELPAIQKRAEDGELAVIPILLEECDWQRCGFIAERQFLPSTKPLIDCTENEREWSHARSQILSGIRRRLAEGATRPEMSGTPVPRVTPEPGIRISAWPLWVRYVAVGLVALALVVGGGWALLRSTAGKVPQPETAPSSPTEAPVAVEHAATPVNPTETQYVASSPTGAVNKPAPTSTLPAQPTPSAPSSGALQTSPTPTSAVRNPSPTGVLPVAKLSDANAASMAQLVFRSKDSVNQMVWLPGGSELLLSVNHLVAYDAATRQEKTVTDEAPGILAVAKGADGGILVAGVVRDTPRIWDASSGREVVDLADLKNARSLAMAPDGSLLAAGIDKAVKLVELPGGQEVNTLLGVDHVELVAFSPDGKTVAAGGTNVVLWNVADGSVHANFPAGNWVRGLAFSPDGAMLAVGTYSGLKLYDVTQIDSLRPRLLRAISEDRDVDVAWSPDSALLAWTSSPALVKLWDVAGGRQVATLKGHTSDVTALGFSPDGTLLATASSDGMRLWGATAGGQASPTPLPAAGPSPSPVPLSPAAISAANAGRLAQADVWKDAVGYSGQVVWSPDGAWLAGSSTKIYDVATRQTRSLDPGRSVGLLAAASMPSGLSGNGPLLVTVSSDAIELWDVKSGAELATYPAARGTRSLAMTADGSLLAAGIDKAVKLVEIPGGQEVNTLLGVDHVELVTFSPDGKTVAAGGTNVVLWSVADGSVVANFPADNWVRGLAFSPDGAMLAVGTYSGLKLYDATQIDSLRPRLLRAISEDRDVDVAWSPDSALLAWTSSAGPVKLWAVGDGREVASLSTQAGTVTSLAFSPDGALLATAGDDGAVRLWGVAP